MLYRIMWISLAWLLALPVMAEEVDKETLAGIQAVLQAHDKALGAQDVEGVLATYADGDNTVLLGTGPGEIWVGKEELKDAYEHIFQDYDAGTMQAECGWRTGNAQGDMAWLMAMCDITDAKADAKREFPLNISAVLVKQDGNWRFRNMHISNPTSGEQ